MIPLLLAAALVQGAQTAPGPDPNHCFRAPRAEGARPGCPDWRLVTRDARGARYFAPSSAVVDGDIVEVMTRTDIPAPVEGATLFLAVMRLDCARRTFTIGRTTGYSDDGIPVVTAQQVFEERPVRPGHDAAVLLAELCPRRG